MFFEGHRVEKKRRCCENNASICHRFFIEISAKIDAKSNEKPRKAPEATKIDKKTVPESPDTLQGAILGNFEVPAGVWKWLPSPKKREMEKGIRELFWHFLVKKRTSANFHYFFNFCTDSKPNFDDFLPNIEGNLIPACHFAHQLHTLRLTYPHQPCK